MSKKYISTLEFYNYGENNRMDSVKGSSYKVKISDKEGNIITIEDDDGLYACVKLSFDAKTGILTLLDVAHDDSVIAEVEMPNAEYIYNCRYDEELNAILFDIKSLYGDKTDTIELDVEDLVELYEAGQGIEIGEKNEETGRKPISIKIADGEELLQLTDDGLGLDSKVITEEELETSISGKADTEYVDELFSQISAVTSGMTEILDKIEAMENVIGTDVDDPNLDERIDEKADREDLVGLEEEVGEIEVGINSISGDVESLKEDVESLKENVEELSGKVLTNTEDILNNSIKIGNVDSKIEQEIFYRKANSISSVDYDSSAKTITFANADGIVIDSIDATDFVKDGMIDSVSLETTGGTSYLVIVWNTDAGKEITRIDIGDLFEVDNYYTKTEIDIKVQELKEADAEIINTKADKTALDAEINRAKEEEERIEGKIDAETVRINDLEDALNEEITRSTNKDNELNGKINDEKDRAQAEETSIKTRLNAVETGLTKEITDRTEADRNLKNELIGSVGDTKADLTIHGVKKYADYVGDNALSDAKDYTNGKINDVKEEINSLSATIDTKLTAYVTKDYVDSQDENLRDSLKSEFEGELNILSGEAFGRDNIISGMVVDLSHGFSGLSEAINSASTLLNAITTWDGEGEYTDDGNGVLDVLHREFHEYVAKDGIIESIDYDGENLIITYKTTEGERVTIIPVGTLVDLTDYYKKEEVDNKLDKKADLSALTEVISSLDDNTEAIDILNRTVISLNNKIDVETARASGEESRIQSTINNEIERATSAETELQTDINAEEQRAQDAESALQDAIDAEVTRATSAEQSINNRIDNLILECGIY